MSLMPTDSVKLFEALCFLSAEHSWLAQSQVTNFFAESVWQWAPDSWLQSLGNISHEELNQVPFGFFKDVWPETLQKFVKDCSTLPGEVMKQSLGMTEAAQNLETALDEVQGVPKEMRRGMSPKKEHEVCRLAKHVHDVCARAGCACVLDVGCGLGYLGEVLHRCYALTVRGLEGQHSICDGAAKRHAKIGSCAHLKTTQLTVTNDGVCLSRLLHECREVTSASNTCSCDVTSRRVSPVVTADSGVCIAGLHCCGDLTPTLLRLFCKIPEARALVLVSCCYHRMSIGPDGWPTNFPISRAGSEVVARTRQKFPSWCLSTSSLRLAAQQTRASWGGQTIGEHVQHRNHVAFRGVIQAVLDKRPEVTCKKKARKLVSKSKFSSFPEYLETFVERNDIEDMSEEELKEVALQEYDSLQQYFSYIEPYTALQVCLQPVLEAMIHLDRLFFLAESGLSCRLVSVFDPALSPRHCAVVACR